jgi:hypothetical protein
VVEVAHDFQQQIRRYVVEDLKMVNSYDTWHGTKNVAKVLAKVIKGRRGNPIKDQLSDKRGSTKRHLYWCMKNCNGSPEDRKASIMNISNHYQNIHTNCYRDSPCRHPTYSPSKVALTDPTAIEVYEKALKDTMIYKHAEYYCRVGYIPSDLSYLLSCWLSSAAILSGSSRSIISS